MGYPSFAVGDVLTASDMNAVGLWRITPTVSGTGMALSGSEIVMTDVTAGEVRSIFSSSYRHYRVIFVHNASTTMSMKIEMLSGTNTVESGTVYRWASTGYTSQGNAYNDGNTGTTSFTYASQGGSSDAGTGYLVIDFINPNAVARTWISTIGAFEWTGDIVYKRDQSVLVDTATQYTGFKVTPSAGNIDGWISVYGYKN